MSSNGSPSLAALLGLVAVAGYQNRDKIGEFVKSLSGGGAGAPAAPQAGGGLLGGITGVLGSMLGGGGAASGGTAGALASVLGSAGVAGGLGELVTKFSGNGMGDVVKSWVGTGPNDPVNPSQLESALGGDTLNNIIAQTGLSREELLQRLSAVLPEAVDKLTPGGRLPS